MNKSESDQQSLFSTGFLDDVSNYSLPLKDAMQDCTQARAASSSELLPGFEQQDRYLMALSLQATYYPEQLGHRTSDKLWDAQIQSGCQWTPQWKK